MKISIITVCFNSQSTIEETIKSVIEQDYQDLEYIVIDGGSNDQTVEIIRKYTEQISYFISEPDKGIYDAMNKGLEAASGDLIGILNSDDFYVDGKVISRIAQGFINNPKAECCTSDVVFVDGESGNLKVCRYYSSNGFKPWQMRFGFMPAHPGTFLTRELVDKVGKYNTSMYSAADFEYFVRVFLVHRAHFFEFPEVTIAMRLGGVSTSGFKSYWRTLKETLRGLKINSVYSNGLMCSLKFPIKLIQYSPMFTNRFSIPKTKNINQK